MSAPSKGSGPRGGGRDAGSRDGAGREGSGRDGAGRDRLGARKGGGRDQGGGGDAPRRSDQRIVVGLHPVRELLRAGEERLVEILLDVDRERTDVAQELVTRAREAGVPVIEVPRDRIDEVAEGLVHQGVVARAGPFRYAELDDAKRLARHRDEPLFLVALDGVTDPHNLGAIARSAEGFGAHGLIVPARRAAGVTAVVEKAAAGALAHLPVVRITNLVSTLRTLKEEGVWIVGLESNESAPIAECPLLTEPLVLVVGSEGRGLARMSQITCDALVKLPMRGRVGSFNASVAAAVACHEVMRRRGDVRTDGST